MKKTLVTASCLLALSAASIASAQGINLSWTDCGVFGNSSQTFDCASNSGAPFSLVASFVPPPNMNEFVGLSSQIDFSSTTPTLPDWWRIGGTECRGTSGLTVSFDFTAGPFSCADFWTGAAAGGYAYDVGFGSPNRARMRIQGAVPFENRGPISAGTEYYAYKVNVGKAKSFGTGACAGCQDPMCIVLNEIQLFQPPEDLNDPVLNNPLNSNFTTWQASSVPGCPQSTPTHNSSWGQVKSLYR